MHPKAGPALARRLESAQDYDVFEVNIFLREEPAKEVISSLEGAADSEGRESRINVIRRATEVSQRPLLEFLEGAQRESLRVDEAVSNSASEQRRNRSGSTMRSKRTSLSAPCGRCWTVPT